MKGDNGVPPPVHLVMPVPGGDHPVVADHLARRVLELLTAALTDIEQVASVHADMAPASSEHVQRLAGTVAGQTLAWLEAWPT